ncbi:GNAT family N-acetyltransferase [Massilia glaciei]|uniref:GNAT family N-acetyltransferase n=1 Tax=Massilia glaciei TaxID=1524097 RepID=A0A2U2I5E4_9BURK|nr:GNAT family N-acetyltransferase [Massilia glaciei]PWF54993.1 GNAT family N-acetyltransferase [Massilia glaciei]
MQKKATIRRIEERDLPEVAGLLAALAGAFILPEMDADAGRRFLADNDQAAIAGNVANGFVYHVAESAGAIAGFVGVREHAHIFHLYVDTAWQRRGVARALWDAARRAAVEGGNQGVFTVNSSNHAVGAYAALGFVPTAPMQCVKGVFFNPMRRAPT